MAKASVKKTSSGKTSKRQRKRAIAKPRRASAKAAKKTAVPAKRGRKPLKGKTAPPAPPANMPDLLQVPVASNVKPRKNQAGMTVRELQHFRDLLLAHRHEIVGDMSSMELEAMRTSGTSNLSNLPIHMADMGTDNYEQEFTLGLMEKDRNLLRDINNALAKIQSGTFGLCEATGKPISKARLEAQPWARFSIEHARSLEHGGVR